MNTISARIRRRVRALQAILLAASALASAQTVPPVALSVTFTGDTPSDASSLIARVQTLQSAPYSPFAVRTAIEDLYRLGLFAQVEAFVADEPGGARLRFHLTGKVRVASVRIAGNALVPTSVLTNAIALRSDSEFARNLMDSDVERLRDAYRRRGFYGVAVGGSVEIEGKKAVVRYSIVEGAQAQFGSLTLNGVDGARSQSLRDALQFPTGTPFSQAVVDKLTARTRAFYRSRRFLMCEAAVVPSEFDPNTNRVDVALNANEGKRVDVRFDGNERFSDATLLKNATLESVNAFGFRKTIADLTQFYLKEGYFQARVDAPQITETDDALVLAFPVSEGERRYIREVRVEGNDAFSDRAIRGKVKTRSRSKLRVLPILGSLLSRGIYDPLTLEQDKRLLEVFYRDAGYRAVKVFGEGRLEDGNQRLVVLLRIQEGARSLVQSVGVVGNSVIATTSLLKLISSKVGGPLDDAVVVGDRERIRAAYASQGYPYCDIPQPEFDAATGRLLFSVYEGKPATVGAVTVRFLNENPKTQPSVVMREIGVKPGEPFNAKKLADSQQRVFRLGLFRTVRMDPAGIYEGREVIDIPVVVRERNAGSVNVGGGYSPSEGVRGTFEVVQRNLGGTGRRLGTKLRLGTLGNRYEVAYVEPWTLWTPTRTTLRVFRDDLEEQDNTLTNGVSMNLSRALFRFNQLAVQYRFQRFSLSKASDGGDSVRDLGVPPTLSGIGASFQRDTRDDLFNPKRGWFHELSLELSGGALGGESQFVKSVSDTRAYRAVGRAVWATQIRLGYTSRLGSDREISSTERFRLGGSTTIRGYPERSFGERDAFGNYRGDILFQASSELRVPVYRVFGIGLFVDSGNLWNRFDDIGAEPLRVSVGSGLRVVTPIGPARFDVGYPLNGLRDIPTEPRYWIALGNVF